MAIRKVYPVSVLNRYVKMRLDQDPVLSKLWVMGEISNFKRHSSGHLYFTLKDENGAIPCVMFAQDARRLLFRPAGGERVQAYGQVSLYEKTGTYQLYVRDMEMDGVGRLYQEFEALKARLQQEGLFEEGHKKPLPFFPKAVGIVTSPTGAAIRDICQIAKRRFPGVKLILYPALVQGEGAAPTIVKGIQRLDAMKEVEVIIVGRGGGSIEDLWPFNEESVARAIYEAKTPIVSAVGHETDFTIADFVSDLRAPTPSAAAELCVPEMDALLYTLETERKRQRRALLALRDEKKNTLETLSLKLNMKSPFLMLRDRMQEVDMGSEKRSQLMKQFLEKEHKQLEILSKSLELSSPMYPLGKGYTLTETEEGKIITSVKELSKDEKIQVIYRDGKVLAKVQEILS